MSFPFEEDLEEDITVNDDAQSFYEPIEYGIDFKTGKLTGEIVTGLEAVRCWCYLALRTPRYRHVAFSWDYGCEIESLIGKFNKAAYIKAKAEEMVSDCLLENPHIQSIKDFDCTADDDRITYMFIIDTDYGEASIYV